MLLHAVFCAIRADVAEAEVARVFAALDALQGLVPGLLSFEAGPNLDLEGSSQRFTHGFAMRFESRAALEVYARHPAHLAAGRGLVAICEGGAAGIMVFDLQT